MSAAPADFDRGGFSPVRIQIEQIRPITSSVGPDGELRADMDSEESGTTTEHTADGTCPTSDDIEGEITISLASSDMTGSIPGASFGGPRDAAPKINTIALKRQELLASRIQPGISSMAPVDSLPAPVVVGKDSGLKAGLAEPQGSEDSAPHLNPETKPIAPADRGSIDGMYICSSRTAAEVANHIRSKFLQVTVQIGQAIGPSSLGRTTHNLELKTILVHGPPDQVSLALDAAQQRDTPIRQR